MKFVTYFRVPLTPKAYVPRRCIFVYRTDETE